MTYTDITRRIALRNAIFAIADTDEPSRSQLADIGRRAAEIAGRAKPWSGSLLYNLINFERLSEPHKFPINALLFNAVMKMAGLTAMNGKQRVVMYAGSRVREGSIIFGRSHKCARRACVVHFVGDRKFCSDECMNLKRASDARRRARERKLKAKIRSRRRSR